MATTPLKRRSAKLRARGRVSASRSIPARDGALLRAGVAALGLLLLGTSATAEAGERCPLAPAVADAAPAVGRVDPRARLRFITTNMDAGARRALGWSLGWGLAYGAAAVTMFSITPLVDADTRKDLWVGAASASIGAITRAVSRPAVIGERRRLRRKLAAADDVCDALWSAEAGLLRSARWEHRNRRLFLHLAALTYNTAVGLVLGVALDRPLSGIRQAAIGAVVGQVMFLSQPMTTARALTRYRAGILVPRPLQVHTTPWIVPAGGGVRVGGRF